MIGGLDDLPHIDDPDSKASKFKLKHNIPQFGWIQQAAEIGG